MVIEVKYDNGIHCEAVDEHIRILVCVVVREFTRNKKGIPDNNNNILCIITIFAF